MFFLLVAMVYGMVAILSNGQGNLLISHFVKYIFSFLNLMWQFCPMTNDIFPSVKILPLSIFEKCFFLMWQLYGGNSLQSSTKSSHFRKCKINLYFPMYGKKPNFSMWRNKNYIPMCKTLNFLKFQFSQNCLISEYDIPTSQWNKYLNIMFPNGNGNCIKAAM